MRGLDLASLDVAFFRSTGRLRSGSFSATPIFHECFFCRALTSATGHCGELAMHLPKEFAVGITAGQFEMDTSTAHFDARADLKELQADGANCRVGQFGSAQHLGAQP